MAVEYMQVSVKFRDRSEDTIVLNPVPDWLFDHLFNNREQVELISIQLYNGVPLVTARNAGVSGE